MSADNFSKDLIPAVSLLIHYSLAPKAMANSRPFASTAALAFAA